MILIFILFCFVIGFIGRKTNSIFSLILGIFGLTYFTNGNSMLAATQSLVQLPALLLDNSSAMFLIVILLLLFILSNLLNLINIDYVVDRKISTYNRKMQQFIVVILSFFATNLDLSNSDIAANHKDSFELNSGITPFINPISIMVIFLSSLLLMFNGINGLNPNVITLLLMFNIPAIWWLFKSIVNLLFKYHIDYPLNYQNLNKVRPSIEIRQSYKVQTDLSGTRFLKKTFQIALFSVIPTLFLKQYKVVAFMICFLILMILYSIRVGVIAVYNERIMSEEQIYITIRDSLLGIGPELVSFLLVLVFTSLAYDFIERFYASSYTTNQLFVLALLALAIGMVMYKDYLMGFAFALPITLVWVTSNYAIDEHAIRSLYITLLSIATLFQIFYYIDLKKINGRAFLDLTVMLGVVICTLLTMYLANVNLAIILFIIFALMYIISLLLFSRKARI